MTRVLRVGCLSAVAALAVACAVPGGTFTPTTPTTPPSTPAVPLHGPAPAAFDGLITVRAPDGTMPADMHGSFVSDDPNHPGPYACDRKDLGGGVARLACHFLPGVNISWGGGLSITAAGFVDWHGRAMSWTEMCSNNGQPACQSDGGTEPTLEVHLSAKPIPQPFTQAQLADLQSDLMAWVPALALTCGPDGVDHRANINCTSDNGTQPRGLMGGWVWTLSAPSYVAASDRELIYGDAIARGWTHFPLQVAACTVDGGYHGLYPRSAGDCGAWPARLNLVADELHAHHLIVVCAGVAPDAPLQPGFDVTKCDMAMNDWDNATQADCRIDAIAAAFPATTPLLYELPGGAGAQPYPDADACSTVTPTATNGGQWLASVLRRHPNFLGMLVELGQPDGIGPNVGYLTALQAFWRDVRIYLFETDTYWKFWQGLDVNAQTAWNDQLRAAAPWLSGYFSGGTSHPAPITPSGAGKFVGTLDAGAVQIVEQPDFRSWPMTATISQITLTTEGVIVDFSKKDGPGRWPDNTTPGWAGPLQYSLGIALNVNGTWYADAPDEFWYGLTQSGGQIQDPTVTCSQGFTGQVACNWFYSSRWGALTGQQPKEGDLIGLFVVAGDARNNYNPVAERSEIVTLVMPAPGTVTTFTK